MLLPLPTCSSSLQSKTGRGSAATMSEQQQRSKKDSALDLSKLVDKSIRVKLAGGREGKPAPMATLPRPLSTLLLLHCGTGGSHARFFALQPTITPVSGVLKGYDQLLNLVLDEAVEYLRGEQSAGPRSGRFQGCLRCGCASAGPHRRSHLHAPSCLQPASPNVTRDLLLAPPPPDPEDPLSVTDQTRGLGLIVCRGTSVMMVVPTAGMEQIANPFQHEGDAE